MSIQNFWEKTSTFLCKTDFNILSLLSENINNHFMLPPTVNDVRIILRSLFSNIFQYHIIIIATRQ